MIWAVKNDKRVKATPNQKAICPLCNNEVIPKCGEIKIWHWAHKSGIECDSFKEPETEWHINWKERFPKEQQEVTIKKDKGYHRADIKTRTGLVIELQNSPISIKEIRERENFYGRMIWLLNEKTFGQNIIFKSKKILLWKWIPSIIYSSSKPLFIDFKEFIIKINDYWLFRKRTYCSYNKYSKKEFLHLYGDIYDFFSDKTKLKQRNLT